MHKISQHMLYDRLFPILQTAAASEGSIEVVEFFSAFAMDFINAYLFGLQNASDFMHDAETRRRWLELYQSRRPYRFWVGEMPGFIKALKRVGIHILPKWYHEVATRQLEDWVLERCNAAAKDAVDGKPAAEQSPLTTTPVVYKQLVQSNATASLQGLAPFPQELRVATEIMDHLAAGHETAGITLTYLFHELSLHPVLQTQIRHEFLTLSPRLHYPSSTPTPTLPDPRTIDALPILHACLMETLRIHAAIPGPQPRITPSTPTSLAGSAPLPPGVRVSAQAYTLHRNSTVFPEPEVWKPERWLEASEGQRAEMGRWFWAFGSGGRMCIGSNFAMQGMFASFPRFG